MNDDVDKKETQNCKNVETGYSAEAYDDDILKYHVPLIDHCVGNVTADYLLRGGGERDKIHAAFHMGLFVVGSVVNVIKGNKPSNITCTGPQDKASEIMRAEVSLLKYLSDTERFAADSYQDIAPVDIRQFTVPLNTYGIYLDNFMIEYAFEHIKANNPARECRVKSNINAGKATIEYLSLET